MNFSAHTWVGEWICIMCIWYHQDFYDIFFSNGMKVSFYITVGLVPLPMWFPSWSQIFNRIDLIPISKHTHTHILFILDSISLNLLTYLSLHYLLSAFYTIVDAWCYILCVVKMLFNLHYSNFTYVSNIYTFKHIRIAYMKFRHNNGFNHVYFVAAFFSFIIVIFFNVCSRHVHQEHFSLSYPKIDDSHLLCINGFFFFKFYI